MSSTVHNERLKLTATYLNGLYVAIFAVGGFAPILTFLSASTGPSLIAAAFVLVCFPSSVALRLAARHMLKKILDDDA